MRSRMLNPKVLPQPLGMIQMISISRATPLRIWMCLLIRVGVHPGQTLDPSGTRISQRLVIRQRGPKNAGYQSRWSECYPIDRTDSDRAVYLARQHLTSCLARPCLWFESVGLGENDGERPGSEFSSLLV